jgi:alpha-ketoglutarate-dependent taurine dioxygenase
VAVPAAADLVAVEDTAHSILSIIRPTTAGVDLGYWLSTNRQSMTELLARRGAVLFRGFAVPDAEEFQRLVRSWSPDLLEYTYGSTPRSRVGVAGVYTSTEYPADQTIPQHNEMAYTRVWPNYLWFYCATAAEEGGATPLADSRRVAERIDRSVFGSFADREVRYVRNYGTGFDLTWQQAFEAEDRAEVEARCQAYGIEYTWLDDNRLRTSQICQATIMHPVTGKLAWFNQAHLFHTSALGDDAGEFLLSGDAADVPRQAYFGDGGTIPNEALEHIREIFVEETVREPWQNGDVLLVDNMVVSHGRDPYRGARRVLVAMTDEYHGYREAAR